MIRKLLITTLLISVVTATGCSNFMARFAANSTVNVAKKGTKSFDRETDLWLAETSATSNLKFFEGILESTPENEALLVMLSKSYALYAFAFLEWKLEHLEPYTDAGEAAPDYTTMKNRAVEFNLRARRYAIRRMELDFEGFGKAALSGGKRLWEILDECDEDHISGVYFLALSWGALINLQNDDPEWLADLGRVKKIMAWVRKRAPNYMHGGPHMFHGMINTALPQALGGQPAEAKKGFEAAIKVSDGKYLLPKALYARKYMVAVNDRAGYERLLQSVIDAPADIYPNQALSNAVAKQRAKKWITEADDLFDSDEEEETTPADATDAPAATDDKPPAENAGNPDKDQSDKPSN